jgi:type VI secretion system protein ImpL
VDGWLRSLRRWAFLVTLPVCMAAPPAWACGDAQAAQCARANAIAALQRLDALADASHLYQPEMAMPAGGDDAPLLQLGSGPVLQDYLARQLDRVRFLAGQAQEFVALLASTGAEGDGPAAAGMQMAYWQATIHELQRHTQARDDGGQAGALQGLVVRAAELTPANCRQKLAAEPSPALGNDLFSRHRRLLGARLQQVCADAHAARWRERYIPLAQRFNRELAGRYPFAGLDAPDAPVPSTLDFFASYSRDRAALAAVLQGYGSRCLAQQRAFLAALDQAAGVLGAGGPARPVILLEVMFRARPEASPGSEQLIGWHLFTPHGAVDWPERSPQTLRWALGEPLTLDLRWAEQSRWRPSADAQQSALTVEGAVASFSQQGAWALLRLMDAHGTQATDLGRTMLAFRVPLSPADGAPPAQPRVALLHVGLALSTMDPRTRQPQPLAWPRALPRTAPQDLSGLATETCINLPS